MLAAAMERQHLSADGLLRLIYAEFKKIPDHRTNPTIPLADALMAGFAVFSLKAPSLLAFDQQRRDHEHNLKAIFGMSAIPCDTQMRTILDEVDPSTLRPVFTSVFRAVQRGKSLESFVFYEGHYLLASDGTTYFNSENVHCPGCLEKHHRNGTVTYSHQMLGLAIVHPDHREVIPLGPEAIIKQDGDTKNDCECNATRRALKHFRREHPKLPVIIVEDALSANAPHIADLQANNARFILGIKPGSHKHLFRQLQLADEENRTNVLTLIDDKGTLHHFRWLNNVELNESNPNVRVNVLDYWEVNAKGHVQRFTWITDFELCEDSVWMIMRGGRCRWKIENETFNTLKNQGYQFEHNFGHGEKNLSVVFALLMMLAFLIDQTQQLCDSLFVAVWKKSGSKRRMWELVRSMFHCFRLTSMRQLLELLLGFKAVEPPIMNSS